MNARGKLRNIFLTYIICQKVHVHNEEFLQNNKRKNRQPNQILDKTLYKKMDHFSYTSEKCRTLLVMREMQIKSQ